MHHGKVFVARLRGERHCRPPPRLLRKNATEKARHSELSLRVIVHGDCNTPYADAPVWPCEPLHTDS